MSSSGPREERSPTPPDDTAPREDNAAESPDALRTQAQILVREGRFGDALPVLQRLVDHDPRDAEAWELVARAFYGLGDEELTARAANAAITADPYAGGGYVWKTRHQLRWGSGGLAVNAGREGVEMTHGDPEVRIALAEALLRRNATTDAAETIHPLLFAMPEYPPLMALQGEVYRRQAQEPAAIAWFTGATDRDPKCAAAWAGMGELHRNHERWVEAGKAFHLAAVSAPEERRYRAAFVETSDEVVGSARPGFILTPLFAAGAWLTFAYAAGKPLLILAGLLATVAVWNLVRFLIAQWVLSRRMPEVVPYYRFAKPRETRLLLGGCGILLAGLLLIGGLGFVTANGLWAEGLRTLALVSVVGAWVWWGNARLRSRRRPWVSFRFPDDDAIAGLRLAEDEPSPVLRGWRQLMAGNPKAALRASQEALDVDAEQTGALHLAAVAALCLGDAAKARAAATYAQTLEPDSERPTALRWMALAVEGRPGEAAAEAEMAPELLDPSLEDIATFFDVLGSCSAIGPMEAVVDLMGRLAPEWVETYRARGDLASVRGRHPEAELNYRAALAADPSHNHALTLLGVALHHQGKRREACLNWSRALQVDPSNGNASQYLQAEVSRVMTIVLIAIGVSLGVVALIPTLTGSPRNNWAPLMTLLAPWALSALARVAYPLVAKTIAPVLGKEPFRDVRITPYYLVPAGTLLMLLFQSVQVWSELALHPQYLAARWPGAAVITLMAVSGVAAIWIARASEQAAMPSALEA